MGDGRDGIVGHIDAVDRSLVYVPRDNGVAGTVVRVLADPAGAKHLTVANFEQTTFQVITHTNLH
jgi:hypothetical protein